MLKKKTDDVINDCTEALKLNNRYTKALSRRAKAYETKGGAYMFKALEGKNIYSSEIHVYYVSHIIIYFFLLSYLVSNDNFGRKTYTLLHNVLNMNLL